MSSSVQVLPSLHPLLTATFPFSPTTTISSTKSSSLPSSFGHVDAMSSSPLLNQRPSSRSPSPRSEDDHRIHEEDDLELALGSKSNKTRRHTDSPNSGYDIEYTPLPTSDSLLRTPPPPYLEKLASTSSGRSTWNALRRPRIAALAGILTILVLFGVGAVIKVSSFDPTRLGRVQESTEQRLSMYPPEVIGAPTSSFRGS